MDFTTVPPPPLPPQIFARPPRMHDTLPLVTIASFLALDTSYKQKRLYLLQNTLRCTFISLLLLPFPLAFRELV